MLLSNFVHSLRGEEHNTGDNMEESILYTENISRFKNRNKRYFLYGILATIMWIVFFILIIDQYLNYGVSFDLILRFIVFIIGSIMIIFFIYPNSILKTPFELYENSFRPDSAPLSWIFRKYKYNIDYSTVQKVDVYFNDDINEMNGIAIKLTSGKLIMLLSKNVGKEGIEIFLRKIDKSKIHR